MTETYQCAEVDIETFERDRSLVVVPYPQKSGKEHYARMDLPVVGLQIRLGKEHYGRMDLPVVGLQICLSDWLDQGLTSQYHMPTSREHCEH